MRTISLPACATERPEDVIVEKVRVRGIRACLVGNGAESGRRGGNLGSKQRLRPTPEPRRMGIRMMAA